MANNGFPLAVVPGLLSTTIPPLAPWFSINLAFSKRRKNQ
jgi:hypothetical protein